MNIPAVTLWGCFPFGIEPKVDNAAIADTVGADNLPSPLGSYNQPEDICILAKDSSEACNLISDVVNYEIADEDESFYEYLERVGRLEAHGLDGWREEMAEFEALEAVAA